MMSLHMENLTDEQIFEVFQKLALDSEEKRQNFRAMGESVEEEKPLVRIYISNSASIGSLKDANV